MSGNTCYACPRPLNIGIDNAIVVKKGHEIIEHMRKKQENDMESIE